MEAVAEVCVDLDYCSRVILNNNNNNINININNVNEDAGRRLDTAAASSEYQGGSCIGPISSRPDDDDMKKKKNTSTSTSSSVMVLIDEGAGDFVTGSGGGGGGGKEKRKFIKAKKPPKGPPHTNNRVDDEDDRQIIIMKELAELAMIKRARIERMKALIIQKKNSTSSSSSSSSSSGIFAMLFTILVFLVLLFQGGMSCQISCGTFNSRGTTTDDQAANENSFIFIQEEWNPSAAAAHDFV